MAREQFVRAIGARRTIHIRAGDIWKGGLHPRTVHPEYHALPFSFYDGIVRSKRWSKVRVVSEDRRDPMVQELVASYDAEVQSANEIEDFNLLRASSNLVLSVSSYAWWAGWLSQASQIFFQWPVFSIKLGHLYDPWPGSRIFGSTTNHDMFRFDPLG